MLQLDANDVGAVPRVAFHLKAATHQSNIVAGDAMGKRKDRAAEKKAFVFLNARLKSRKPFTVKQLAVACGWKDATPRTYLRKRWHGLVEKSGRGKYSVNPTDGLSR